MIAKIFMRALVFLSILTQIHAGTSSNIDLAPKEHLALRSLVGDWKIEVFDEDGISMEDKASTFTISEPEKAKFFEQKMNNEVIFYGQYYDVVGEVSQVSEELGRVVGIAYAEDFRTGQKGLVWIVQNGNNVAVEEMSQIISVQGDIIYLGGDTEEDANDHQATMTRL